MKTIVHTCDICKKSVSEEDLSHLSVTTMGITISTNKYAQAKEFDICKSCLEKKGFIINPIEKEKEAEAIAKNENTLRNKILEILTDLDVQFFE